MKILSLIIVVFCLSLNSLLAQKNHINTFHTSYFDTSLPNKPIVESGLVSTFDDLDLYATGTAKLNSDIALSAEFFTGYSMGDEQLIISGRYNLSDGNNKLAVGPAYEFRNGSIGVLWSFRYVIDSKFELVSKSGIFFSDLEVGNSSVILGTSLLHYISESFTLLGEVTYSDEGLSRILTNDNLLITSFGTEYVITPGLHFRGVIGYNLLDSNRDLVLSSGVSYSI